MMLSRRAHEAHDQPDRNDHDGAEQEIAPYPAHRIEAHVPDRLDHAPEAVDDVARVEAERVQDHADQHAQEDEPERDCERRPVSS